MKKTLTVNLGGTVFHIDEDAYLLFEKNKEIVKFVNFSLEFFKRSFLCS